MINIKKFYIINMKKYMKINKWTILSLMIFASFGVASVSVADFTKTTDVNNGSDNSIAPFEGSTTVQTEISSLENSVQKTENTFNKLDGNTGENTDANSTKILQDRQDLNSGSSLNVRVNKRKTEDVKIADISIENKTQDKRSNVSKKVLQQVNALKLIREDSLSKYTDRAKNREDSIRGFIEKTKNSKEVLQREKNNNPEDGGNKVLGTSTEGVKSNINTEAGNFENNIENSIPQEETKQKKAILLNKKEKIIARNKTKQSTTESSLDSDGDGISNYDEKNVYGTNPYKADTNGNGYVDGAEILAGFNPTSTSTSAIIRYKNPKNSGIIDTNLFAVSSIKMISRNNVATVAVTQNNSSATSSLAIGTTTPTTTNSNLKVKIPPVITPTSSNGNVQTNTTKKKSRVLSFKGKSLPNSFITVFIYSIPTIVTVKTDADGNWNYTMDKELQNGNHVMYVAMTDSSGDIITKSKPIPFVKEALAVTVNQNLLSNNINNSKPSFFSFGYIYITILILVFLIGIAFTIIGLKLRINNNKEEDIV